MVASGATAMPHTIKTANHRLEKFEESWRSSFIEGTFVADWIVDLGVSFVILKKARLRWERVEKENVAWQRPA